MLHLCERKWLVQGLERQPNTAAPWWGSPRRENCSPCTVILQLKIMCILLSHKPTSPYTGWDKHPGKLQEWTAADLAWILTSIPKHLLKHAFAQFPWLILTPWLYSPALLVWLLSYHILPTMNRPHTAIFAHEQLILKAFSRAPGRTTLSVPRCSHC